MKRTFNRFHIITPVFFVLLVGCERSPEAPAVDPAQLLRERLISARSGEVIEMPAGRLEFKRGLTLNADGVVLRGAGAEHTVLSFSGQLQGAEGLLVNADDVTLEDFAVLDTPGDAIKINQCARLTLRRLRVEWSGPPSQENGAYGLYPVQCEDVLVEDSFVRGASDAGIYVGQSNRVVVRNNNVTGNVAGIEIENSVFADVYGNTASGNTGGILVFNMPYLPQSGHSTRVFNNRIEANNHPNFAAAGVPVASVPAGSGVVVNSNDRVEIFDNDLIDNDTAHVIISSVYSTNYNTEAGAADDPGGGDVISRTSAEFDYNAPPVSAEFDPYPEQIYIHGNRFKGGGTAPGLPELLLLKTAVFGLDGHLPEVLWDGYANPERLREGVLPPQWAICIDNPGAGIVNVDQPGGNASVSTDIAPHVCTHPPLPAVRIAQLNGADEAS